MQSYNPEISIIVLAYNIESCLEGALQSALCQTYGNIEIIVVDDGSTDSTRSILLDYASKDERIKPIVYDKNRGLVYARKQGVDAAQGRYTLFLDGDDTLETHACAYLRERLESEHVDILHFNTNIIDTTGNDYGRVGYLLGFLSPFDGAIDAGSLVDACFLHDEFSWHVWGKLFRTGLLRAAYAKTSDENIVMAEDVYISFILLSLAKSYRGYPDAFLYNYHIGRGITVSDSVGLDQFKKTCVQARVIQLVEHFLFENKSMGNHKAAFLSIKERLLGDSVKRWCLLKAKDRPGGFDHLLKVWNRSELITAMGRLCWQKQTFVAESIRGAEALMHTKKTIKTIASYCNQMQNEETNLVVEKLIDIWIDRGYEVILLTDQSKSPNESSPHTRCKSIILPASTDEVSWAHHICALDAAIQDYAIDMVVCHNWTDPSLVWDVVAIKAQGLPCVVYAHGVFAYPSLLSSKLYRDMMSVYQLLDCVVVLSRVDELYWGSFCDTVALVSNPLVFDLSEIERSDLDSSQIVWIGSLEEPRRGFSEIIEVMAEVTKGRPDLCLTVVVTAGKRTEIEASRKLLKERGLESSVMLADLNCRNLLYAHSSILVSTSGTEDFALALAESKAFGLPCIAYELPYHEMHREGKGLIKVPSGDKMAMATEIIKLMNDPATLRRLGADARESIENYLQVDHGETWTRILNGILSNDLPQRVTEQQGDAETRKAVWYTQSLFLDLALDNHHRQREELSKSKSEFEALYHQVINSKSWKVGSFITWIPRKLKQLLKERNRSQ